MLFRMLYDDKLAQASYLIGCQRTGEALVIDPERDADRYIEAAARAGMKIKAIAETHIHADYLSGARELAERTGARLYLSDEGGAEWKYRWLDQKPGGYDHRLLKDGDTFQIGHIEMRVLHTPGHTPEHLSFMVTDRGGGASEPMGIATGDFVFVGDVGRPDLLETAAGQSGAKEPAARQLYQSLQRFKNLPEYLQVWPAHGSGSACGKALGAVPQSTVGYEKRFNAAVTEATEERHFVRAILTGQPEPPLYFARMKLANRDGPKLLGKLPAPPALDATGLKRIVAEKALLFDTRPWSQFREGHLPGALWAPLNNYFPSTTGSYVEPGTRFNLLVAENRVKEAVTDLIRIGLEDVVGYVTPETFAQYQAEGGRVQRIASIPVAEFSGEDDASSATLLDVRGAAEFEAGHLPNAINIAYTHLATRLGELARERPIMVYCRTDNRSGIAAALLQRNDFDVTHLGGGFVASQEPQRAAAK